MPDQDLSLVVATRNRPHEIGPCVETLRQNASDYLELLVVDQSDDDASERALRDVPASAKLRYLRTATRGLSKARNLAIESARGALIAFTDDDCRVPADWARNVRRVFEQEPETDVIFGRVTIPPIASGIAHAASFEPYRRFIQRELPDVRMAWGIGANMSMRRSLVERIGPFDTQLGAGATFRAGEEVDFTIRALTAGARITYASEVTLQHLGVRLDDDASKLMRGYLFATGAVFAKHLRLRTPGSVKLMADTVAMHALNGARNVAKGVRPTGIGQLIALTQGVWSSLRYGIDAAQGVYRAPGSSGP